MCEDLGHCNLDKEPALAVRSQNVFLIISWYFIARPNYIVYINTLAVCDGT